MSYVQTLQMHLNGFAFVVKTVAWLATDKTLPCAVGLCVILLMFPTFQHIKLIGKLTLLNVNRFRWISFYNISVNLMKR